MMIALLRRILQGLQTRRESAPLWMKLALAALMLAPFTILLMTLRARARLGRGVQPILARTRHGDLIHCRPPDFISLYVWLFGEWEPDLTRFIQRRLARGDGFVDVGANLGYYSVMAARCVSDGGAVVAIEASPAIFNDLKITLSANPHGVGVRLINKAAAAIEGHAGLYSAPRFNVGRTTTVAERSLRRLDTVIAAPLGALLTADEIRCMRLLKVDVEGGEVEVLSGLLPVLADCRDDLEIVLELSPQWWSDPSKLPLDILQPFLDAGFFVYEIPNNYWPWRYLWPNCVGRPQRVQRKLDRRVRRLDLVLSKQDVAEL